MRTYKNYTDEDIIKFSKQVKSIAGLLRKLELKVVGGNYANIKKHLQRLKVDTDHWTGQGWNKDQQTKNWNTYSKISSIKKIILSERGHICESCGNSVWMGEKIPLEIDHIDGDRTNNDKSNLKLLCCNCHALTPTWRGRGASTGHKDDKPKVIKKKIKNLNTNKKQNKCSMCNTDVKKGVEKCIICHNEYRSKKFDPSIEELKEKLNSKQSFCSMGKEYGVSDNAVRKRCKKYNLI